jgi:hypothetical protein
MIVYKTVDLFSQTDGMKIGTKKIVDHQICDFTGHIIDRYSNPNTYEINYNDNDPCFGDGHGEGWLYKWNDAHQKDDDERIDAYDLFSQGEYIFETEEGGIEVFAELIKTAKKEKFEILSLDQLLRWSRARMLEKVITMGIYTIEQFSCE